MKRAANSDLFLGTVYGAALSLAMWALALDPPGLDSPSLGILLSALLLGLSPRRLPFIGRVEAGYAAALAGALIGGPGISVAAVGVVGVTRRLVRGPSAGRHPVAPWSLRLAAATVAATSSAALALVIDGTARGVAFVACHVIVFSTIERSIALGACRWCARRIHTRRGLLGRVLRLSAAALLASTIGGAVAALASHASAGSYGWIASAAALVTVGFASRRTARSRRDTLRRRFALRRHVARALACAGAARGAPAERARRLERMACAVAARMELDAALIDALGCAALLHHARAQRDARRRPFEIDDAVFPHPVSTILQTMDERWDGMGPRGLRSRRIHVGARILAAVSSWIVWSSADDGDEAIGRVLDDSGRRFDPLVVDALIDQIDTEADAAAGDVPRLELIRTALGTTPVEPVSRTLEWAGRELDAFYGIARATGAGLDVEATLTLVAARLATLVPHSAMVVYRLEGDRRLRPVFASGSSTARLRRISIPLGDRLSGRSALDRTARIGEPIDEADHDLAELGPGAERERLAAALAAPMVVGGRTIGVLSVYDRVQRRFGTEDRRRIARVAACIAELVDRGRAASEATTTNAMTDPLTGLPSAAFLDGAIAERLERGAPFGLLGIRLRGVDRIAARHGAHGADRVLASAAGRLGRARRANDTAVRLGDDLFVVLTDSRGADDLLAHAARITHALRGLAGETDASTGRVRPVVAHACCPADGESVDALLETLDGRLADAVERGRGVVPFRSEGRRATSGSTGSAGRGG